MTKHVVTVVVMILGFNVNSLAAELLSFEAPVKLPAPINVPSVINTTATVTPDGLTMYFTTDRRGVYETWVAERSNVAHNFSNARSYSNLYHPNISGDGLSMVMNDPAPNDVYMATRMDVGDPFGPFQNVGTGVNSVSLRERWASLSHDRRELYFSRNANSDFDPTEIYVATRPDVLSDFGTAERLPDPINLRGSWEDHPTLSPDGLILLFASDRPGGYGGYDIWASYRDDDNSAWGEPVNLGPQINSDLQEWAPDMTADSQTLYFARAPLSWATGEIWSAAIVPEPSSLAILLFGIVCFKACAKRR